MNKSPERIIEALKKYRYTHEKVDIGQKRRRLLRKNYERLKAIEENSSMGVQHNKASAKIRIVSRSLFSCSQAPAFLTLVGISDICAIDTCRGGFIIDLEFNLWMWKKRTRDRIKGTEYHI